MLKVYTNHCQNTLIVKKVKPMFSRNEDITVYSTLSDEQVSLHHKVKAQTII